jgi:hypothetical protein
VLAAFVCVTKNVATPFSLGGKGWDRGMNAKSPSYKLITSYCHWFGVTEYIYSVSYNGSVGFSFKFLDS